MEGFEPVFRRVQVLKIGTFEGSGFLGYTNWSHQWLSQMWVNNGKHSIPMAGCQNFSEFSNWKSWNIGIQCDDQNPEERQSPIGLFRRFQEISYAWILRDILPQIKKTVPKDPAWPCRCSCLFHFLSNLDLLKVVAKKNIFLVSVFLS